MSTIIAYPSKPEEEKSLIGILKALNIPFETRNITLHDKIKEAREQKAKGELKVVNPENIWESI